MLSSDDEVIDYAMKGMGAVSSKITADGYEDALRITKQELNVTWPLNDPSKEMWVIERAKRHALNTLLISSADKFKFENINLQNKFTQYAALIKKMDEDFEKAMENQPDLFNIGLNYGTNIFTYFPNHCH